jgi:hypothetical protein
MVFGWFKKELSDEEKTAILESVRADFEGEALSDGTLRRYCVAREWDKQKIVEMLQSHLAWRKETLPVERTPAIEKVLESGRIRLLRGGSEPVICVDFKWGRFLLDGFETQDIVKAQICVLEDALAEADAASPEGVPAQFISVSTGGPPPTQFIKDISPIFDVNYPERMKTGIIYPIPRWLKHLVDAMLIFLSKRTRDKFVLLSEEAEFVEKTGLPADKLPEDLKGGIEASKERRKKAMEDEQARNQMPKEFQDAMADADQNTQVMMSQVAC